MHRLDHVAVARGVRRALAMYRAPGAVAVAAAHTAVVAVVYTAVVVAVAVSAAALAVLR